jgi:hypothetical protein
VILLYLSLINVQRLSDWWIVQHRLLDVYLRIQQIKCTVAYLVTVYLTILN